MIEAPRNSKSRTEPRILQKDLVTPERQDGVPAPPAVDDVSAYLTGRGLISRAYYGFCAGLVRWTARLFLRLRTHDIDRVPDTGAVILAANHQSVLDPPLVGCMLRRHCCFLARDSLFRIPFLSLIIRNLNAMPVPRESIAPKKAIQTCLKILDLGWPLVFFPEGTRTRDGQLGVMRRGVALLARRSGAPVVPIWVDGAYDAWPPDRRLPRPRRVQIYFGNPLWYDEKEHVDGFLARLRGSLEELRDTAGKPILGGEAA